MLEPRDTAKDLVTLLRTRQPLMGAKLQVTGHLQMSFVDN